MIKDLKKMNSMEEKLQCGLYHPRQGMWLDPNKTLLSYDLSNEVVNIDIENGIQNFV
jgi:hypothetical protein